MWGGGLFCCCLLLGSLSEGSWGLQRMRASAPPHRRFLSQLQHQNSPLNHAPYHVAQHFNRPHPFVFQTHPLSTHRSSSS